MRMRLFNIAFIVLAIGLLVIVSNGCQEEPVNATPTAADAETRRGGERPEKVALSGDQSGPTNEANEPGRPKPKSRGITYRADGVADLSFDDIALDLEADEYRESALTDVVKSLDGKRIIVRGFILASVFKQSGIKEFVLVRDNQECCFGPGAKIYHNMQVEMVEGPGATFTTLQVTVEGTFSIRPWYAPDGKCYSIYHLAGTRVGK